MQIFSGPDLALLWLRQLGLMGGRMANNKLRIYLGVTWLLTLGLAYAMGWWSGITRATSMATGAVQSGFPVMIGVLAIVALISGIAAFRARGYFNHRELNP